MALHRKWLEIREDDLGLKFNRELPEMVLQALIAWTKVFGFFHQYGDV